MKSTIIFLAALTFNLAEDVPILNFQAYQSLTGTPVASDFPEYTLLNAKKKSMTGIGFSGGGSRAFTTAIGYLSGLDKLGLIDNVRYIGGISGGSWATAAYTYVKSEVKDDQILLGRIVYPADIEYDALTKLDYDCLRRLPTANFYGIMLKNELGQVSPDMWIDSISEVFLEPIGVKRGTYYAYSDEEVQDIKRRNPSLEDAVFNLPAKEARPFMILGASIIGPNSNHRTVYGTGDQNYTLMEMTSSYIGQAKTLSVESFAFGGKQAPLSPLAAGTANGTLSVSAPSSVFDLARAVSASSWAPGSLYASMNNRLAERQAMILPYWSPAADTVASSTTSTGTPSISARGGVAVVDTTFGDGGEFENIPLISFLQRGVNKVVLFFSSSVQLQPSSVWNVTEDPSYPGITSDFVAFFGALPINYSDTQAALEYYYVRDQVFSYSDYEPVVLALQDAQAKGKGILATFNLTTVENAWWGIPAGQQVEVTFSMLGRLTQWES
jgi:hypothetical protein